MSKKATLSSSGSLASCLHFAAQVLLPGTKDIPPAPEALTKDVLAPIVVDAHRFGLQMTKMISGDHNPRKLLNLCREKSDEKAVKALNAIAVADITWDFQGSVADTLEMELEDLLQRSLAGEHSICALFSVSAPETASGGDEHALVWIPAEENSSVEAQKHSMLLYVCPGRVKVVKTVGGLVRKMREEVKTIRDGDASYCVWSIITAPKADGCRRSRSKEPEVTTRSSSTDALKEMTSAASEAAIQSVISSKGATSDLMGSTRGDTSSVNSMAPMPREPANNDEIEGDRTLAGSTHEKSGTEASSAKRLSSSKVSIFSFSRATSNRNDVQSSQSADRSLPMLQRDDEDTARGDDKPIQPQNDESCVMGVECEEPRDSLSGNQEDDSGAPDFGLTNGDSPSSLPTQSQSARTEWLASHPHIPVSRSSTIERRQQPRESTPRLSHSVDDHIARSCLHATRVELRGREETLRAEPLQSPPRIRSPLRGNSPSRSPKAKDTSEVEGLRVSAIVRATTIVRVVVKKAPNNSIFAFTGDSSSDEERREPDEFGTGAEQDDLGKPLKCGPGQDHASSDTRACATSLPTDEHRIKSTSPVDRPLNTEVSSLAACDPVQHPAPTAADSPPQEVMKKSARERVRSKLGAKVWWELEYTARQLEQEVEQSKRHHNKPSSHPTGSGWPCNEKKCARQQVAKPPISAPTVEQEATKALTYANNPFPNAVAGSSLEVIAEERSAPIPLVRSLVMDRESHQIPSYTPLPHTAANIHAKNDAQGGQLGSSCYKQAASGTVVMLGSRDAPEEQQKSVRPEATNCSRSNAEAQRIDPGQITQARPTVPEPAKVSLSSMNAEKRRKEPSSKSIGLPSGPCKLEPQSISLSWVTTDSSTSVATKEAYPKTTTIHQRLSSPPRGSSRALPQERASADRLQCEQRGKICVQQSDCDWTREHSNHEDQNDRSERSKSDQEVDQVTSQTQSTSDRSSFNARSRHNASLIEKTVEQPHTLATDRSPSGDTDLPFHMNGRVPIRAHPIHSSTKAHWNDLDSGRKSPERGESASAPKEEDLPVVETPHRTASSPPSRVSRPPAAATATFIPFHDAKTVMNAGKKEAATRMDRLNELRQKKLEQLHKAREQALQQQQEKKHKQQEKKATALDTGESTSLTAGGTVASHPTHHQPRVKRASNRQQLQNAIEFTLLAGQSNERERLAALEALTQSTAESFVVLVKSAKELKFRALYESRTDSDEARRIHSVVSSAYAPPRLTPDVVAQFFKYSSAKKQFLAVDTRSFTVTTDACALVDQLVFKKMAKPRLL